MAYTSSTYTILFQPLHFAKGSYFEELELDLAAQNHSGTFKLVALRQRMNWAVTLPPGVFSNDFREPHDAAREAAAYQAACNRIPELFTASGRAMSRGITQRDGVTYFHQNVIAMLRRAVDRPALLEALHAFLEAAKRDPKLIKGETHRKRPIVPLAQRKRVGDRYVRGADWSQAEDLVLRQWFGQRTAGDQRGTHVTLTDVEWDLVLARLNGLRTKAAIRSRIFVLNAQLRRELSVNGFIPVDRYVEYWQRVLGESPRPPRTAPRPRRRRRKAALEASPAS